MGLRRLAPGLALLTLVALVSEPSAAEERIRGLRIRPAVRTEVVFDDNPRHERRGGDADVGFGLAPSLAAEYGRGRWNAGAEVGADVRLYTRDSDLDETFWNARGHLEFEPLRGLVVRVSERYAPQPVDLGRPSDETTNLRQSNTLVAEARYWRELKRESAIEVGIRSSRFDTQGFAASVDTNGDGVVESVDDLRTSYWDVSAFVEAQRKLGRRFRIFARGQWLERRYDEIPVTDFTELSGMVGLRADLGRLDLELAFGYGVLDFEGLPSNDRFLVRLQADWELGRDWRVTASVLNRLTGDVTGTDFGETGVRVGVEKRLGARTSLYAGTWWSQYDSQAPGARRNTILAAEVRLRRQLTRRIEAVLAYRRWLNEGDFDDDDFTQNRVTLGFVYRY